MKTATYFASYIAKGGIKIQEKSAICDVHYGPTMMSQGKTTASVGAFHLERPLNFQITAFEGSFQVKCPHRSCSLSL